MELIKQNDIFNDQELLLLAVDCSVNRSGSLLPLRPVRALLGSDCYACTRTYSAGMRRHFTQQGVCKFAVGIPQSFSSSQKSEDDTFKCTLHSPRADRKRQPAPWCCPVLCRLIHLLDERLQDGSRSSAARVAAARQRGNLDRREVPNPPCVL